MEISLLHPASVIHSHLLGLRYSIFLEFSYYLLGSLASRSLIWFSLEFFVFVLLL